VLLLESYGVLSCSAIIALSRLGIIFVTFSFAYITDLLKVAAMRMERLYAEDILLNPGPSFIMAAGFLHILVTIVEAVLLGIYGVHR